MATDLQLGIVCSGSMGFGPLRIRAVEYKQGPNGTIIWGRTGWRSHDDWSNRRNQIRYRPQVDRSARASVCFPFSLLYETHPHTDTVMPTSILERLRIAGIAGAAAIGIAACEGATEPLRAFPGDLQDIVTAETMSDLNEAGQFRLPAQPQQPDEISPVRARELAEVYVRIFGPRIGDFLERRRGAPIEFSRLRAASRVYYAATPYEQLPQDVHAGVRKSYGSYYLVPMVMPAAPEDIVLSIAVSALNTDVTTAGADLKFAVEHGSDFLVDAVRQGTGITMPVTPEWAAQAVAHATGARVMGVPELERPSARFAPMLAMWKVTIDRPVRVQGRQSGMVRSVREVYVGVHGNLHHPMPDQPSLVKIQVPDRGRPPGARVALSWHTLGVHPGRALWFEPVTVVRTK